VNVIGIPAGRQTSVAQAITARLRLVMRGRVDKLAVRCDAEMINIRGEVESYFLWQLGLSAVQESARDAGGFAFDYRIDVVPQNGRGRLDG
jgi:hypothetical protein